MSHSLADLEVEAAILGAAMIDNNRIDRIREVIGPEDFEISLHGRIWTAILHERDSGRHAAPITLRGYFDDDPEMEQLGGIGYLARLTGDPSGILVPAHELARQIKDLATRRRLRAELLDLVPACEDLETSIAQIVGAVDAAIRLPAEETAHLSTVADCMNDLIVSFDLARTGVSCGIIPSLDKLLGELRPGSLTVLAARPGMGKTAVAISYARGAADKGHGVQFFSHEMSGIEIVGRLTADMCFDLDPSERIPYRAIRDRDLSPDKRRTIQRAADNLQNMPFAIVDTGSISVGRLRAMVRSCKRRLAVHDKNLDLVVIDYLQLVRPDRPMKSSYEAVSEVSREIKAIAMEEQVAVVALAQLSRSVEQRADKRPILSDLRESGQIEQDADAVLFLLREEYYLRQSEQTIGPGSDDHAEWESHLQRVEGVLEFILAKRRNGPTGTAYGRFFTPFQAVRGI